MLVNKNVIPDHDYVWLFHTIESNIMHYGIICESSDDCNDSITLL